MPRLVDPTDSVCIGIEFAWWGGVGRGSPESSADVLLGQGVHSEKLWCRAIDLRSAPNPRAKEADEPNYDADAAVVTTSLEKEIRRLTDAGAKTIVLAINAPILTVQTSHLPRRRILTKGEKGSVTRRSCEVRFLEKVKEQRGIWSQGVSVQPGAPIAPRINHFVERLTRELGFVHWSPRVHRTQLPERVIIETLPLEAVWALGVSGAYGELEPERVARYRKCQRCVVAQSDAKNWAKWALRGFAGPLGELSRFEDQIETIANLAVNLRVSNGNLRLTKRYTAIIDAAIAWFTARSFQLGNYHEFVAEDDDGCIVGPGIAPHAKGLGVPR